MTKNLLPISTFYLKGAIVLSLCTRN